VTEKKTGKSTMTTVDSEKAEEEEVEEADENPTPQAKNLKQSRKRGRPSQVPELCTQGKVCGCAFYGYVYLELKIRMEFPYIFPPPLSSPICGDCIGS
jgi:hypothetical protein